MAASIRAPGPINALHLVREVLVIQLVDRRLAAFDLEDGHPRWTTLALGGWILLAAKNAALVQGLNETVALDPQTGAILYTLEHGPLAFSGDDDMERRGYRRLDGAWSRWATSSCEGLLSAALDWVRPHRGLRIAYQSRAGGLTVEFWDGRLPLEEAAVMRIRCQAGEDAAGVVELEQDRGWVHGGLYAAFELVPLGRALDCARQR